MPSIEIICVGQAEPIDFSGLPLAVEAETALASHRGHSSLFQADFDRLQGCIYHLGNPHLRDPQAEGAYTAFELLSKADNPTVAPGEYCLWHIVHFTPKYARYVGGILRQLLVASPDGRVVFTSDYQFGPRPHRYERPLKVTQFWQLHNAGKIRLNAWYELRAT